MCHSVYFALPLGDFPAPPPGIWPPLFVTARFTENTAGAPPNDSVTVTTYWPPWTTWPSIATPSQVKLPEPATRCCGAKRIRRFPCLSAISQSTWPDAGKEKPIARSWRFFGSNGLGTTLTPPMPADDPCAAPPPTPDDAHNFASPRGR